MSTRSIAVRLRSLEIPSSWKGWQTYERTRAEAANWEDLPLVLRIEGLMDLLSIGRNSAYTLVNSGQSSVSGLEIWSASHGSV